MSGRWADKTDDEVDGIPDTHHDPGDGPAGVTPEKVSRNDYSHDKRKTDCMGIIPPQSNFALLLLRKYFGGIKHLCDLRGTLQCRHF